MKNFTTLLLCCIVLAAVTPANATFSLRVGDPRISTYTQQGSIKEALLSVKPVGLFWEYGLYLTFSAQGTSYNAADTLEVTLKFELPEQAIVHDSWLWINDDIIKAKILDKWTAGAIYESIVQRRRDPSILYKTGKIQYELRVFPMKANQTRKVKITWLMPTNWKNNQVQADLPLKILTTSKIALPELNIIVWPDDDWTQPEITSVPATIFSSAFDPASGKTYQECTIPSALYTQALTLKFPAPLTDGFYFRKLDSGNEGFYQLAFSPRYFLNDQPPKKVAFLFDNKSASNSISIQDVLNTTKTYLHDYLTSTDSFNLFYSNLAIGQAADNWLPADSATIEYYFNNLGNVIGTFSNLVPLLTTGINFVQTHGADGKIVLIANSTQFAAVSDANPLINALIGVSDPSVPIHVIDYYNGPQTIHQNGRWYYGNEYLFLYLAQFSIGSYQSYRYAGNSLTGAFTAAFDNISALVYGMDFHTSMDAGFCHGRFYIGNASPDIAYENRPIVQIGQYTGSFPFKIDIAGEVNNVLFQQQFQIAENSIGTGDTLMREMWFGKYIQLLENGTQNNSIIVEILENSLPERVLSLYSAFLCPEDLSLVCEGCVDETELVYTIDASRIDSLMIAFPNPFVDKVTIHLNGRLSTESAGGKAILEIRGADGRLLHQETCQLSSANPEFSWDGRDLQGQILPSGLYIAVLQTNHQVGVLKLLKG